MRKIAVAVIVAASLCALSAPAVANLSLAEALEYRCFTALFSKNAHDHAFAPCLRGAEEWAKVAVRIPPNKPTHWMALLYSATMLSQASVAGRKESRQRDSVYLMQRAIETDEFVATTASAPSDARAFAKQSKIRFLRMLMFEKQHPVSEAVRRSR